MLLMFFTVPEDSRNVIVSKLSLVVEGRTDKELDLTGMATIGLVKIAIHISVF